MTNVEVISISMTIFAVSSLVAVILNIVYEYIWRERMILKEFIKNEEQFIASYTVMLNNLYAKSDASVDEVRYLISQINYHGFVKAKLEELQRYRKAFDTILYRVDLDKAYFEEHNLYKSKECEKELERVKGIIKEYLNIDAVGEEE